MGMSAPDADTKQVDELHDEFRKLIKNNGLKKAIIRLRALNNSKEEVKDIDTYEHIIETVIQVYGVTEKQLYDDVGKFVATDARRTAYVLLHKYLDYTQANIGVQFGKTREAVKWSMMEFNKMINDASNTIAPPILHFRKKHAEAEKIVETQISKKASANSSNSEAKKPEKTEKTVVNNNKNKKARV